MILSSASASASSLRDDDLVAYADDKSDIADMGGDTDADDLVLVKSGSGKPRQRLAKKTSDH